MILRESYELCPYLRELQRESRRNAMIRNAGKCEREDRDEDIPEESNVIKRVKAHMKRRVMKPTRNKWVSLSAEYAADISASSPFEKERIREYLQTARESLDGTAGRKRQRDRKQARHAENKIA